MQSILHAGCGADPLPAWLDGRETRLDINPAANPHVVASMLALGDIGQFDVVLCQHALEHLYPHEVGAALAEFMRVLRPGGHVIVIVPDLQDVRPTEEVLVDTPAGPITGLDMIFGCRRWLADNPQMAHHTGFTAETLRDAFERAGFRLVVTKRLTHYNLMGVARK